MTKYLLVILSFLFADYGKAQIYNLNGALNGQTINTCRGLFRDSGGGSIVDCILGTGGNYSINEDRTVTFCSTNGRPIRVSFIWWDLETGFDGIFVHDGPSTASPQLIAFTGFGENWEFPNFYTSSGTCLTFRFVSDNTINWCGWEAIIGCEPELCNGNEPAADNCGNAPIICDFEGYCGNTTGWYTPDVANIGTTGSGLFCGSIENNSWVSFIADETSASFRVTSNNCTDNLSGIQAMIMATPNCTNFSSLSNCVNQDSGPGSFNLNTNVALVPGNRYYIMIDGFAGNICDYTITPISGVRALQIIGPPNDAVCVNETATLTVEGAGPGATYEWQPAAAISGANTGASITANPGSNTTTYTVTVATPSGCAVQTLNYTLLVNSLDITVAGNTQLCQGESTTLTATATPRPSTISFSNNTAINIPDNNATGITSNINVTGLPGTVGNQLVSVCLDISHPFIGDIEVLLSCPSGTTINLVLRRGGAGANFTSTCFSTAGPAISTGAAPFTGTFTPEQALSNLSACLMNGNWSLIVRDRAGGDAGTLLGWTINFVNTITYSWSPGTGLNTTVGPVVTASPGANTTYTVTATDLLGCTDQTQVNVVVLNPNGVRLDPTGPQCSGTTLNFSASPIGGNGTYDISWTAGTTPPTNGTGSTFSFSPTNTTGSSIQVPVTLTVTSNGQTCTQQFNPIILPEVTPTFTPIGTVCSGTAAPTLPTVSTNGITGTWSPAAVSNTASGTYTFTPNAGQCATTTTLDVTVTNNTTPIFAAIPAICSGTAAPTLPAVSTNGITGTWSPATVSNTASGTYTFTPNAGQCATTTTLDVMVTNNTIPTFAAIPAICSGTSAPTLPAVSTNGITGTWSPATVSNTASGTYTFTPNAGQCATTTTLDVTVTNNTTPTFAAIPAICSGTTAPTLPAVSTNGITGTWSPATVSNTASATYTFTPTAGQCATTTTLDVTVTNNTIPTFAAIPAICSGTAAPTLPAVSTNGITGTWSPATVSNTASGTYTFTPNAGQCATTTTLDVTVTNNTTPTFAAIPAICSGTAAPTLPAVSTNGITGTWSPATVSNTASGTYTFTPNAGQCATTTTLDVTVTNNTTPTFAAIPAICSGTAAPTLPAVSTNGITGTWSPATVSNTASGTYTFTPNAGQCATTTTLDVTVTNNTTPTFAAIPAICSGTAAPTLPSVSTNGITGTWSPAAVSNTASGTYTFTPNAGQCALSTQLNVTVNPRETPLFDPIPDLCQGDPAPSLPAISQNGISGTWFPANVNTSASGTYTFTPESSACAEQQDITITVKPSTITTVIYHD